METNIERVIDVASGPSHTDVGAGVAAILVAAEQAAEKIRNDAQNEAATLIREAREAISLRQQSLTAEAERVGQAAKAQAEQIIGEAESAARNLRLAVEAYEKRSRQEADDEATGIVATAEMRATRRRRGRAAGRDHRMKAAEARFEHLSVEVRLAAGPAPAGRPDPAEGLDPPRRRPRGGERPRAEPALPAGGLGASRARALPGETPNRPAPRPRVVRAEPPPGAPAGGAAGSAGLSGRPRCLASAVVSPSCSTNARRRSRRSRGESSTYWSPAAPTQPRGRAGRRGSRSNPGAARRRDRGR